MNNLYDFLWNVVGYILQEYGKDFTPVVSMNKKKLRATRFSKRRFVEGIDSLRFVYLLNPVQKLKLRDVTVERIAEELNSISETFLLREDPDKSDESQEDLYDEMMSIFCYALLGKDMITASRNQMLEIMDRQKAELAKQNELIVLVEELKQRLDRINLMLEAFRFLSSHTGAFIRLGQWLEKVPLSAKQKSLAGALYLMSQENRELNQEEMLAIQKVVESEGDSRN